MMHEQVVVRSGVSNFDMFWCLLNWSIEKLVENKTKK